MKSHNKFEYEVFPPIDSGEEEEEIASEVLKWKKIDGLTIVKILVTI